MKNEEERLRLLDELFPMKQESCLVFGINREGIITRFNDDFELLIGKSKEEVINKPISTFFADDPQLLDRWMDVIAQARANNDFPVPASPSPITKGVRYTRTAFAKQFCSAFSALR